jgi:glycine dehydrogenase subunit 1
VSAQSAPGDSPTPYVPNTPADQHAMLSALGFQSIEDLFSDLPAAQRNPAIGLPPALPEFELVRLFEQAAARNAAASDRPSFLGAGAYRRFIPSVTPYLISRSEFATAYTPYQPEISQGTLQSAFEYQSVVCELTGMDVSNTGLYDGGSATAEACLLAARVTGRKAIAVVEPFHPGALEVIGAYACGADLRVDRLARPEDVDAEHACLALQQPDFLGAIRDVQPAAEAAHAAGALCVVYADPFVLGLLRPPGDAGADIVTGEGRDLAIGPNFGGPSLGLFATRQAHLRQVPGRIVGRTRELHGRDGQEPRIGYVLTLQAREQFIRRERATSNFSTGQSLIALAFTITLQTLGPRGLREAVELCYQRAHAAATRIAAIPGFALVERGPWLQEFLVRGPLPAPDLARRLRAAGIAPGLDVSARPEPEARDALLFCVTEATPGEHVDRLVETMQAIAAAR